MDNEKKEYERKIRLKTTGYDISNLYDLSNSLSPYIKVLNSLSIKDNTINFYSNKNEGIILNNNNKKYNIPDSIVDNSNILLSSNEIVIIDIKQNISCSLDSPSGKITILNGNCSSGQYIKFTLNNKFIKSNNNVLLTINKFDISTSIPVCIVENVSNEMCTICIYNSGIN